MMLEFYELDLQGTLTALDNDEQDDDFGDFSSFTSLRGLDSRRVTPKSFRGFDLVFNNKSVVAYTAAKSDSVFKGVVVRESVSGALIFVFAKSFLSLDDYLSKLGVSNA